MEPFIKVSLTANILMLCFKINKDSNCNFLFNPLTFWCTIVYSRLFQGPRHFSMSPALYKKKNNHNRHKSHNSKRPHSVTINYQPIYISSQLLCNYYFDFSTQYYCELVKLNISEVKQTSKSTTVTLHRGFGIKRWSVNNLLPTKMQL